MQTNWTKEKHKKILFSDLYEEKIMTVRGNDNLGCDVGAKNAEIKMMEIIVGGDEASKSGCDPNISCKDIVTVVSDACNDTTSSSDDVGYDALSLKVHIDKSELTKLSRLRIYLQGKRRNSHWIVFVFVGTLLTLRTVGIHCSFHVF